VLALLILFLVTLACRVALAGLNLSHLRRHGATLPREFEGVLDGPTLERAARYTVERTRFGLIVSVASSAVVIAFVFGGGLGAYDRWVSQTVGSFVGSGVVFFVGLGLASAVLEIPLSVYGTFWVEARYGFNRTTPGLFVADWLKSTLLGALLTALFAGAALWLVQAAPATYWLWAWALAAAFSVFLILISPYLIEPLFFKIKPLPESPLVNEVRAMARSVGVELERVLEMDASRRSSHSNAYFTGLGRVKRVVLFDTLLARMEEPEILAVLAHELGHWKLGHVLKRLIVTASFGLVAFYLGYRLLEWEGLPALVGAADGSFAARVVIVALIGSVATFPLTPLSSRWSRRHEWDADDFAKELTRRPLDLASALIKLSRDNLSNLHPHPLYAAFYYSHPPVIERVRRLRSAA
jgi:STE24 endopeptidase